MLSIAETPLRKTEQTFRYLRVRRLGIGLGVLRGVMPHGNFDVDDLLVHGRFRRGGADDAG